MKGYLTPKLGRIYRRRTSHGAGLKAIFDAGFKAGEIYRLPEHEKRVSRLQTALDIANIEIESLLDQIRSIRGH